MTKAGMIAEIIRPNSSFFDEGKVVLIEEFGKDYATYFTILSAISAGKTSRDRIETACGGEVSGYLTKLERHYGLIAKKQPLFESNERKNCLYRNEIDCVGENEFNDTLEFVEIKRDADRIRIDALRAKAEAFFEKNPELRSRSVSYRAFSIQDM